MALLAMRSRGRPFAETHMGKILQGQFLTEKDFERPLPAVSGHNPPTYDMRTPHDVTSGNMPLSPFDMQCNVQDGSGPSVLLHSCKRGLEAAEIPGSDSDPPPQKRLHVDYK